jgi:hypothetical protein
MIAATVLLVAIALGATVWAVFAGGSDSGVEKCMTVSTASSMGGGVEHACGDAARAWCQAASAEHDAHAQAVQRQCRESGIV